MTTTELPNGAFGGDERTLLTDFLRFYRAVARRKAEGLTDEQLAQTLPGHPSSLSVGGVLAHLASVEVAWAHRHVLGTDDADLPEPWRSGWAGDPRWQWSTDDGGEAILALHEQAVQIADAVYASCPDLDAVCARRPQWTDGQDVSLRWVLIHLVEEHARHAGHLDLLREHLDGVTGD